jgi:membrane-associated protease RseP (regulator of RpoE activity)
MGRTRSTGFVMMGSTSLAIITPSAITARPCRSPEVFERIDGSSSLSRPWGFASDQVCWGMLIHFSFDLSFRFRLLFSNAGLPAFRVEASAREVATEQSMGYKTGYQGTFVVSAGPVFTFGNVGVARAAVAAPTRAHSAMMIPALGAVLTTRENNDGAEIVELISGSAAELAGLRVGNVINAVDGTVIKTPMELAVELSNKTPGSKIKIGHTYRYWQTETVLILSR